MVPVKRILLLIVAIALLITASLIPSSCASRPPASNPNWQPVEVQRGQLTIMVNATGNIEMPHQVELAFGAAGVVEEIAVQRGDWVEEGQLLARLNTYSLEKAVSQAELALRRAEYDLKQIEDPESDLVRIKKSAVKSAEEALDEAEDTGDDVAIARAKTQLKQAEYELEQLEKPDPDDVAIKRMAVESAARALEDARDQLEKATLIAPFAGVVTDVPVKEGETVAGATLARPTVVVYLLDPTQIELKIFVDEIDIPKVKLGQKAIITVDALPGLKLQGEVTYIASLATVRSGIVLYEVSLIIKPPQDIELKAGMTATADIVIDKRDNVLLIPNLAIKGSPQKPTVMVLVGEQPQERAVTLGISDGLRTEVISGLQAGEAVAVELPAGATPQLPGRAMPFAPRTPGGQR